jgi:hypothetical protein
LRRVGGGQIDCVDVSVVDSKLLEILFHFTLGRLSEEAAIELARDIPDSDSKVSIEVFKRRQAIVSQSSKSFSYVSTLSVCTASSVYT